jgi:hypothetical protein
MNRLNDERGMVGKLALIWILVAALFVVAAVDGISIVIVRFHLAGVATTAASDGAAAYRLNHDVAKACDIAATSAKTQDPSLKLGKGFCVIDPTTSDVTITLHQEANTILAGRFGPTKHYAMVTDRETNRPPSV